MAISWTKDLTTGKQIASGNTKFGTGSAQAFADTFGKNASASSVVGGVGSIVGAATDIIGGAMANAQIKDTTEEKNKAEDVAQSQFNYDDYDSLQEAYDPLSFAKADYTMKDVRGVSGGEMAMNTIKGTLSGAAAGAKVGGPWGAVAGAAVGLGAGIAGIFAGDSKAKHEATNLNVMGSLANDRYLNNFSNNASNISTNMFNTASLNLAAFGGLLDSDNIDNYTKYKLRSYAFGGSIKPMKIRYNGLGNYFAYGGDLSLSGDWTNGVTIVKEGGSHETNPLGGVPMGVDENGTPNLVEEGEVIFNDYVFSKRLSPNKEQLKEIYLPTKYDGKSYAEIAKRIQKESAETPNDPISKNTLVDSMMKLTVLQENTRKEKNKTSQTGNKFDLGSLMEVVEEPEADAAIENFWKSTLTGTKFSNDSQGRLAYMDAVGVNPTRTTSQFNWGDFGTTMLRSAPVWGSAVQAISDLAGWTNQPNYTNPNIIRNQARQVRSVSARPIGNYLAFNPFDMNYEESKLQNVGLGTQRNILNLSSGNRGTARASLLALNNNLVGQMGDLYRKGLEYNDAQKKAVTQFNAGVNQFNSQMGFQASAYNQRADEARVDAAIKEAAMRDQIESAMSSAKSANITGFWNNLGALGVDQFNQNQAWDFIKAQGLEKQYKDYMKKSKGGTLRKRGLTF